MRFATTSKRTARNTAVGELAALAVHTGEVLRAQRARQLPHTEKFKNFQPYICHLHARGERARLELHKEQGKRRQVAAGCRSEGGTGGRALAALAVHLKDGKVLQAQRAREQRHAGQEGRLRALLPAAHARAHSQEHGPWTHRVRLVRHLQPVSVFDTPSVASTSQGVFVICDMQHDDVVILGRKACRETDRSHSTSDSSGIRSSQCQCTCICAGSPESGQADELGYEVYTRLWNW